MTCYILSDECHYSRHILKREEDGKFSMHYIQDEQKFPVHLTARSSL